MYILSFSHKIHLKHKIYYALQCYIIIYQTTIFSSQMYYKHIKGSSILRKLLSLPEKKKKNQGY